MTSGERARPVVLVGLLLAALSVSLFVRAEATAPRGTVFVGTFFYVDDFYNYLSYVEQAQRGALVFRNKLAPPEVPPALVNLEWLVVGWLSALLGGRPVLAYRLFGLAAVGALVAVADRWLVKSGLPSSRRLPALLLVMTGGGLGGLLASLGGLSWERALDVRTGAFPFVENMANPHFLAGTALLLAALGAFAEGRAVRGVALGTLLGLVRPYDAALLAGVEGLALLAITPRREWPRRLLTVAALCPVLAYDAWLFVLGPGFRAFSSPRYGASVASPLDLGIALGPAALLALTVLPRPERGGEAGPHRLRLALWASLAVALVVLRPVTFSLQFLVGAGLPLLLLGAVGLARLPLYVLPAAVPLMATTAAVVTHLCANPAPSRYMPATSWRVATELRRLCRPGDVVLAPPDLGLYVAGLTPCWAFVSHGAAPDHEERLERMRRFYAGGPPEALSRILDEACVRHVVLPSQMPPGPPGAASPYRLRLAVSGPDTGLAVYTREGACAPGPP